MTVRLNLEMKWKVVERWGMTGFLRNPELNDLWDWFKRKHTVVKKRHPQMFFVLTYKGSIKTGLPHRVRDSIVTAIQLSPVSPGNRRSDQSPAAVMAQNEDEIAEFGLSPS